VAVRHPERVDAGAISARSGRVVPVSADVRDEASVASAIASAEAVVNVVSAYVEKAGVTYTAVHVQGAGNVAMACGRQGVKRLVHVSGIGADAASHAPYIRARGRGEQTVRQVFPATTIIRPSVMFAADDDFLRSLAAIIRSTPVIPLIAGGRTRLQPVHVCDVAEAIRRCADDTATSGKTYELGGPEAYTLREVIRMIAARLGRRPLLVPVPLLLARPMARLLELLPSAPLTVAQVDLLKNDNIPATKLNGTGELAAKIAKRKMGDAIDELEIV
jgi:NADH dehydrogenase